MPGTLAQSFQPKLIEKDSMTNTCCMEISCCQETDRNTFARVLFPCNANIVTIF